MDPGKARIARWTARIGVGLLLFVGTAFGVGEAVIRVGRVEPRVVIVRPQPSVVLDTLHGRVVWEQKERHGTAPVLRNDPACAAHEGPRLQLYGDSIAFGAGLEPPESLGVRLQERLAQRSPPWCVQNLAQPAATVFTELAFAREHVPLTRPQLVVLQLGYGSPRVPVRLGDAAYYLDKLRTDAAGYPTFALGLTGRLHHALFDASRFWAWLTFAVNPGCTACGPGWPELIDGDLRAFHELVTGQGGRLVLALAPPLKTGFPEQLAHPVPWYDEVITWAAAHDVPVVRYEALLADQDVTRVRLNTCCHYNALGTERLADALAVWLQPLLDASTP